MAEPLSIFDLRRKTKVVVLNGGDATLQLTGLTAQQVCDHLERFPLLEKLSISGNILVADLVKGTPGIAAAWIASAVGHHRDEKAEQAAAENLTIEDQAFVIEETMPLTFSRGFGPFLARLGAVTALLTAPPSKDPDMNLPRQSRPVPEPPPRPPARSREPGTSLPDNSPLSPSSTSADAS